MQEDYSQDVQPDQQGQYDGGRKRHSDGQTNGRGAKRMNRGPKSDKPTLKILIPNLAVGKLIGKKGANISELESKHGASIEVSPSRDFFPGSNNRTVTISADIDQIIEFASTMVVDVQDEGSERGPPRNNDFILVITNSAVGFVMGKGGSTIKVIQQESGAQIHIQKQNESLSPGERVVTVSGSTEQKAEAVKQIIEKISVEPDRMSNTNTKYGVGEGAPQYGGGADYAPKYGGGGGGFNLSSSMGQRPADSYLDPYASTQSDTRGYGASTQGDALKLYGASLGVGSYDGSSYYEPKSKVKTHHLIQMEIPNAMVGTIVGKQGVTINEFSRSSGARISFSGKDEFAPGTQDRILTIKGTKSQIQQAYMMVDQKVAEAEAEFRRPQQSYQPSYQPPYQPSYQPSFQPTYQTSYQPYQ